MGSLSVLASETTLCHVPPGNIGNAHTIAVDADAMPAHLAHGDYLGPCGPFGTWTLTGLWTNGVNLLEGSALSATFVVGTDDTFQEIISGDTGHLWCNAPSTSCSLQWTYVYTDTTFVVCDPGCDEFGDFAILGDTMTYSLYDPDTDDHWLLTLDRID